MSFRRCILYPLEDGPLGPGFGVAGKPRTAFLLPATLYDEYGRIDLLRPRQHGVSAGHPIMDAVIMMYDGDHNHHSHREDFLVTLDVRNTFNSARCDILRVLNHIFHVPPYLLHMLYAT